jgi:hypothetical protein
VKKPNAGPKTDELVVSLRVFPNPSLKEQNSLSNRLGSQKASDLASTEVVDSRLTG